MKRILLILLCLTVILFLFQCKTGVNNDDNGNGEGGGGGETPGTTPSPSGQTMIIDHNCTDISVIPDQWIQAVKDQYRIHYAHTSHGEQIATGMQRLSDGSANAYFALSQNNRYGFYLDYCQVPGGENGLHMMDGQMTDYCETYITPDLYWESDYGMNWTRSVLGSFDVNISIWAWCTQLDYYSQQETQVYLDRMAQLESEFPDVTFIYMTGNAQGSEQNRVDRNEQIRNYCRDNDKVLFDFADLDCWYDGEQYTEGGIPMEHPQYHGDMAGHTTYQSCDNKARAFWWLLARLAGWEGPDS